MSIAEVFRPLRHGPFARLYGCYLLCFAASATVDVTAAWALTQAGAPASLIALISTAATLPVVLFILPMGALADASSRVRIVAFAQIWAACVALALATLAGIGALDAGAILALVFLNGLAMAMRVPSLTSLAPTSLPSEEIANAMTLFGMGSSMTRLAGPLMAAAAIAVSGVALSWSLAALLAVAALWLARGLSEPPRPGALPGERMLGALRVAGNYTAQSPQFRGLLGRGFLFFVAAGAGFALGPLAVSGRLGGGAPIFMGVLAAAGFGALLGGMALPAIRARATRRAVLRLAAFLTAFGTASLAFAPQVWLALLGGGLHGAAWVWGLSTFTGLAQRLLPEWVRARGMAVTHMSMVGGVTLGAAVWGGVADLAGIVPALIGGALFSVVLGMTPRWLALASPPEAELTPRRYWPEPALALPVSERAGPAVVSVEYQIGEDRLEPFLEALRESRRMRLRSGALSWALYRDVENPLHFTEQIVFADWSDRLRQQSRTTEADFQVRDRKIAAVEPGERARVSTWLAVTL